MSEKQNTPSKVVIDLTTKTLEREAERRVDEMGKMLVEKLMTGETGEPESQKKVEPGFEHESVCEPVSMVGAQLSNALLGSVKDRNEEEKSILLTFTPGKKPVVIFTGFWNGKFITAAQNGISRAYRQRRQQHIARVADAKPAMQDNNTSTVGAEEKGV